MKDILVRSIETDSVMTKSALPLGGYSANPYVGCPHACKYCYACFMKRFTGHDEKWGEFLDVKYWREIKNPQKYAGKTVVIGSVTDGYNPLEEKYMRTRALLEQLQNSGARVTICTKSDLVLRDLDILKRMSNVTVSWSVNTLDEQFKNDMDEAVSIARRLDAMKKCYDEGIRTVCFVSPIFPGITDVRAIMDVARDRCDFIWLENLNLRGGFKADIMQYVRKKYPDLVPLYHSIYDKNDKSYWKCLDAEVAAYSRKNEQSYVNNHLPDGKSPKGKPTIINYFFHEEVRGSNNTGTRIKKG